MRWGLVGPVHPFGLPMVEAFPDLTPQGLLDSHLAQPTWLLPRKNSSEHRKKWNNWTQARMLELHLLRW